ncbi:MAG: YidC/Oxa1 family membrane protein insertase [Gemmatimonadaceae bacterium]
MHAWLDFVDVIRGSLFSLAHVAHGSTGAAILALSVLVRVALLPLSVKVALRSYQNSQKLLTLQPEIKRLQERYKQDPVRAAREVQALHKQHCIQFMSRLALLNAIVQMPLGLAVYRVITENAARAGRFFFIADLARPSMLVTAIAATLTSLGILIMPTTTPNGRVSNAVLSSLIIAFIVWRLASGVGLYWVGSSAVGAVQSLIVRRMVLRKRRNT